MDVIIFQGESGVAVMTPFPVSGMTIMEMGQRDVPESTPFWIVDSNNLPVEPQETWELDAQSLGKPVGIGGTYVAPVVEEFTEDNSHV